MRGFDGQGGLADAAGAVNQRAPGARFGGKGGLDDFEFFGAAKEDAFGREGIGW